MMMDEYSFKARLQPMVLALLPLLFIAVVHVTQLEAYLHYISSAIVFGCLSFLLAQVGRDFGKKKEHALFLKWGGKPSIQLLRHSNAHLDAITKQRYHKSLENILGNVALPSAADESQDPVRADLIYEACTKALVGSTRDTTKFNLLYKENINYGFRRNLYGLKSLALVVVALSIFIHVAINFSPSSYQVNLNQSDWIVISILLGVGIAWLLTVDDEWVKVPAIAYAERLLEATKSI